MDVAKAATIAAAAVKAGAGSAPAVVPTVAGRILALDGDGFAYSCAGNDDTSPAAARANLLSRVRGLVSSSGADKVEMHLTGAGSNKRQRYAIATVKPYQGRRKKEHKPKNWAFLREVLQTPGLGWDVFVWNDREADDALAMTAHLNKDVVIGSADKDMRMIEARHIALDTHEVVDVREFDVLGETGKQYGMKWFYLQLLQGDSVDNIPGLEQYLDANGKPKLCGPKTAEALLTGCSDEIAALRTVVTYYSGYYKDWADRMVEQAALLWLSQGEKPEDLVPAAFHLSPHLAKAVRRLKERLDD